MDLLKYTILNESDIKDLLISLDKAIKVRLDKEGFLDTRYTPKIYLGESREYLENESQTEYKRPFVTFNVVRRGPASLSDTQFFTGMLQHAPAFKSPVDRRTGVSKQLLMRDNEVKLIIRTKTKDEIYFLQQILERALVFESKYFPNCTLIRFVESKDKINTQDDLYVGEFIFRARTQVLVKVQDDAYLENVNIIYKNTLCKYFDITSQKCVYHALYGDLPESEEHDPTIEPPINKPIGAPEYAQRGPKPNPDYVDPEPGEDIPLDNPEWINSEASDTACYGGTDWCTEHRNISLIKVKC